MSKSEVLGRCGVLCSACPDFTEKNCRCDITPEGAQPCNIMVCTVDKNISCCGLCDKFPCDDMKEFYTESESHAQAFERMKRIK